MGKIKTTVIKRTAEKLIQNEDISFSEDFEENKKIVDGLMPSKRMRNMVAGYITRLKSIENKKAF